MTKQHGGKRQGAGRKSGSKNPNAGRKKRKFHFKDDHYIIETSMIDGLPVPVMWKLAEVTDDYIELQREIDGNTEIMMIQKQSYWNGD